jgi:ribosomal protein L12E/L44/L45/RPP1/RPP2
MMANMKRAIATLLFSALCLAAVAQTSVAIGVKMPEGTPLSPRAQQLVLKKMQQLATLNSVGSEATDTRFSLTPMVSIVESNVASTAPPRQLVKLSLVLVIADNAGSQSTLAQVELSAKGVGDSEEAAVLNALQQVDIRSATLKRFMEQGKKKIAALPPAAPAAVADTASVEE